MRVWAGSVQFQTPTFLSSLFCVSSRCGLIVGVSMPAVLAARCPRFPPALVALLAVVPHRKPGTEVCRWIKEIVTGVECPLRLKPTTRVVLVLLAPVAVDLNQTPASAVGVGAIERHRVTPGFPIHDETQLLPLSLGPADRNGEVVVFTTPAIHKACEFRPVDLRVVNGGRVLGGDGYRAVNEGGSEYRQGDG